MNLQPKPEHLADPNEIARAAWLLPSGHCPHCRKAMQREFVLLTRVIVLGSQHSTAKCSQCKAWVKVRVVASPK